MTGGASGIGRALCEQICQQSGISIVADINDQAAAQTAAAIKQRGGKAEAVRVDVSCPAELDKVVNDAAARHGRLDFMFNNAAICVVGELRDATYADWPRIIEVNLLGVIYGTMAAYAIMLRQQSGHIVNIASMTGLIPSPVLTHYGTTKWGVVGFSTSLRPEAASLGVKVSVACPSLVRTNIPDRTSYLRLHKDEYLARLPWRWMMEPDQAARLILRGVARNRPIIVCPFHGRVLWWCYRFCPALLAPLSRWSVKEFRKLRLEK